VKVVQEFLLTVACDFGKDSTNYCLWTKYNLFLSIKFYQNKALNISLHIICGCYKSRVEELQQRLDVYLARLIILLPGPLERDSDNPCISSCIKACALAWNSRVRGCAIGEGKPEKCIATESPSPLFLKSTCPSVLTAGNLLEPL
jgi:hypothetical protein